MEKVVWLQYYGNSFHYSANIYKAKYTAKIFVDLNFTLRFSCAFWVPAAILALLFTR